MRIRNLVGVPLLYAIAASSVGFSLYFSIGVVAQRGLGMTPLILGVVGLLFAVTTATYVEGGAMFRERGGSSTFARHAFNELISFIAGWAILIDYLIVIAIAAVTVPHYLTPVWGGLANGAPEIVIGALVIGGAALVNIAGITGSGLQNRLAALALADLALQVAIIAVGVIVVWNPDLLTAQIDLFTTPSLEDIVYAGVIGTVAFAGIEAASDLAPDLEWEPRDLRRILRVASVNVPLLYAGIAAVSLMAVPVVAGPSGPRTELSGEFIEEPILGTVQSYDPAWLADVMQWAVVLVAVPILIWAANTSMLGLSRHVYVLATNRQIPSWAGKLHRTNSTPYVSILIGSALAFGLALSGDIVFLAGLYAFGALLAITIAHLSIIRLRFTHPDRERPYKIGFNIKVRGADLPLPAVGAAIVTALGWVSVFAFHARALAVGGGWMLFGLVTYVIYRKLVEGTSLTERVTVPELALKKEKVEAEYSTILVPVFGTELDDDIVATAGRLADAEVTENETAPVLEVIYVVEVPMTVPQDSALPAHEDERAERTMARARDIGEEYKDVTVSTSLVRARSAGAAIVHEARKRNAEVIVMGAEPPTRVRGGAILGGIGAARPSEIGRVTEYVLQKAPCQVLVTAAPAADVAEAVAEETDPEAKAAPD